MTPTAPTAATIRPGAPRIDSVAPGNAQVTVMFSAPAPNGGAPASSYRASCVSQQGGGRNITGPASPLTVANLANGTVYTCNVAAFNAVGIGPLSNPSSPVTPLAALGAGGGAPVVPTNPVATAIGGGQVSVAFNAPGNPAGYVAVCQPQSGNVSLTRTGRGPASPIVVTGLTIGTAYACTFAIASGGPLSAPSNSVTPR